MLEICVKAKLGAVLLAGITALGIAACTTNPPAEPRQTLVGDIRIKGSEPFPTIMLETTDKDWWELRGVPVAEARALAGKRVTAQGTVVIPPGPGTWLPALRVDDIPRPVDH